MTWGLIAVKGDIVKAALTALIVLVNASGTEAASTYINLPGSAVGGDVCDLSGANCHQLADPGVSGRVISYDGQGGAIIDTGSQRLRVWASNVVLDYKGCRLSLRSYLVGSFCPTIHNPAALTAPPTANR